jgi:hypothetical protein
VAVVRATEILLALLVDKILFAKNDHDTTRTIFHSMGATLVLVSVAAMAAADHIQPRIDKICQRPPEVQEDSLDTTEMDALN